MFSLDGVGDTQKNKIANNDVEISQKTDVIISNDKQLDEKLSQSVALSLLQAVSADDVKAVLDKHRELFDSPDNWRFNAKWESTTTRQSFPAGVFAELVVNSMDACLLKKAKQAGVKDLRDDDVPQSMREAVKRYYPQIPEGKLLEIDDKQTNKIADESIFIGIKRAKSNKKYPTYTIVDFGEGQKAEDFKDTFVSVEDKASSKAGIPFVQGRYHKGSTGVFAFLTNADYHPGRCKLIISKQFDSDVWGWTLVRARRPKKNEGGEPIIEYFSPDKDSVPYFKADHIQSLNHKGLKSKALDVLNKNKHGIIQQGTIVKLYEFEMGDSVFRNNQGGLDNALTINLMRCALPIRTYDFDSAKVDNLGELGKYSIHKRAAFSGAEHYLYKNKTTLVEGFPIAITNIGDKKELGSIDIIVYAVATEKDGKIEGLKGFLKEQNKRIFYTINGQIHATETTSVLNKIKFGELANYVIIEVICDGIGKDKKPFIFSSDREKMTDNETSELLKTTVKEALKGRQELRELDRIIRNKNADYDIQNNDSVKLLTQKLVEENPETRALFGLGDIQSQPNNPPPPPPPPYIGELFPTLFDCQRKGIIAIPINSFARIKIKTDVVNDYFSRPKDSGHFNYNNDNINVSNNKLHNGIFTVTVKPWHNAQIGDEQACTFSFSDCQNIEPLSCTVNMVIVEKRKKNEPTRKPPQKGINEPEIIFENKGEACGFNENSGVKVVEGQDGVVIYVNRNNKYLESIIEREPNDRKEYYLDAFKNAIGFQMLSIYHQFKEGENVEDIIDKASSGIAMTMIAVIKTTGKKIANF